jgi:hypothetical protein
MIDLKQFQFDEDQIKSLLDKIVPLITTPENYDFFRGVLYLKATESTSSQFAAFVAKLLKEVRS